MWCRVMWGGVELGLELSREYLSVWESYTVVVVMVMVMVVWSGGTGIRE